MTQDTPRDPSWTDDGVGIDAKGNLLLREGPASPTALCCGASVKTWCETFATNQRLEWKVADMERDINVREPHLFLPKAIAQLEERATEAAAMRGDGVAGKVMWGQAQAYRDAIALLKTFIR